MSDFTTDKLIQQLEQAIQIAIDDRKPTAMIQATMAQAKLLGLDNGMIDVTPDNEVKSGLGWFYGERSEPLTITRTIVDPVNNTTETY